MSLGKALLFWTLSPFLAGAWFWNSASQGDADINFDLRNAPDILDEQIVPNDYKKRMYWGTYRPGVYFGIKGRHQGSLLMGVAWGSSDGKVIRHDCKPGELPSFGYSEHDGEGYGVQELEDEQLRMHMQTSFVKEPAHEDTSWYARVAGSPSKTVTKPSSALKTMSFFVYFGVESDAGFIKLHPDSIGAVGDWTPEDDGALTGSLRLMGLDPGFGEFSIEIKIKFQAADGEKPSAKLRYVGARVESERATDDIRQANQGAWNAPMHLDKFLVRTRKNNKTLAVLPQVFAEVPQEDNSNWLAIQLLVKSSARPRIDIHVKRAGESNGVPDAKEGLDARLDSLLHSASKKFAQKMQTVFPLVAPFNAPAHQNAANNALSNLLGGLSSMRGRILMKEGSGTKRLAEASLFSAVPSRSFFPRGFLWDEGFHGLLVARWQPRIFLDVFGHWLMLQQESGWIPREVALGAEQESRVPGQFLAQTPDEANPPSFLLPLVWLVQAATGPEPFARILAERAHLGSAEELKELVLAFVAKALPRLGAWFVFFDRSQKSAHKEGCYKWAGRSAAHCMASGLDDYPRGLMVNDDECHLDLHAWMYFFAGSLAKLCRAAAGTLSNEDKAVFCSRPDWDGRAQALLRATGELFAPPGAEEAPLADFIGKQPVTKKGSVIATPPWRSDGKCGPQNPVHAPDLMPAECDPYGGGPCCSPSGWCGGSRDFCECQGCRKFKRMEDRSPQERTWKDIRDSHSPHLGYVSLFPLIFGLLPLEHPRIRPLLDALQADTKHNSLWTPYGVASLSTGDPLFRQGEDYWRGKVWGNLNYLTISALKRYAEMDGHAAALAKSAYDSLRDGFVSNVLNVFDQQRFFFENFDPATGEGRGIGPFTGWTTLVVLLMADEPLALDVVVGTTESPAEL